MMDFMDPGRPGFKNRCYIIWKLKFCKTEITNCTYAFHTGIRENVL